MWQGSVLDAGGENADIPLRDIFSPIPPCDTCDSSHRRAAVKIPAARNMLRGAGAECTCVWTWTPLASGHLALYMRQATLFISKIYSTTPNDATVGQC